MRAPGFCVPRMEQAPCRPVAEARCWEQGLSETGGPAVSPGRRWPVGWLAMLRGDNQTRRVLPFPSHSTCTHLSLKRHLRGRLGLPAHIYQPGKCPLPWGLVSSGPVLTHLPAEHTKVWVMRGRGGYTWRVSAAGIWGDYSWPVGTV